MSQVTRTIEYRLETIARSATPEEATIQITSRLPASLKLRLDTCAEFLGMTRNSFLIDLLEAAIPDAESAIRDAQLSLGINGQPARTYDEAVKAAIESGKSSTFSDLNEALNQANAEFEANGKISDETKDDLKALGYPLHFLGDEK